MQDTVVALEPAILDPAPLGELLTAALERLGVNAPGAKAVFYGFTLMAIIFVRPDGVWPWLARTCGLMGRRPGERP